jgi:hypothetical protein
MDEFDVLTSEGLDVCEADDVRVIEVKWSAFRTHVQTRSRLEEAGFDDFKFYDDRARMFSTVLAHKPF